MSEPAIHLDVVASNGVPFRVVLYRRGEAGPYRAARSDTHELVEFYDRRYKHTAHGQFTSGRYEVSALLARESGALSLYGAEADWTIDAETMVRVRAWLASLAMDPPIGA